VYTILPAKGKKITFITDADSISFTLNGPSYRQFNILLGNDTALTGIYAFDTLATLKRAGKYNLAEKKDLPKFTYEPATDSQLIALRKAYNLDSIAGQGDDASKIIRLNHWLHNLVQHDGGSYNPDIRNAQSMIELCRKEKRGLNCRMLATTLNECYLSLGIPSRFVTCLPMDSLGIDQDCHVINMVYLKDKSKWIWMDPSFDAYVMDEKGSLLSIQEVRERLVTGKPLIINPDANWNNKVTQNIRDYLYSYMAKNLYMLETPVVSTYDTETGVQGKTITYMRLVPSSYYKKLDDKLVYTNAKKGVTSVTYVTNNPDAFWAKP
jgi:hypothetical protein